MTIEGIMELVYKRLKARMYEWDVSEVLEADEAIKSAIAALVAQARDEEAEACAEIVMAEQATPHGIAYCEAAIRARIAGRKA